MTTVLDIITQAYRETNLTPIGDVPSADQTAEGLFLLQNLVSSVLGNEAGQPLKPLSIGGLNVERADTTPISYTNPLYSPINIRFNLNLTSPLTITLPPTPRDGTRFGVIDISGNIATYPVSIQGNGRYVESMPILTLNTNNVNREWFYRADMGNWVRVVPIALTDIFPFPPEFNDLFIGYLALRLNPRAGAQTQDETNKMTMRALVQFRARYEQKEEIHSELALLRLSSARYGHYNHNTAFDLGQANTISYWF